MIPGFLSDDLYQGASPDWTTLTLILASWSWLVPLHLLCSPLLVVKYQYHLSTTYITTGAHLHHLISILFLSLSSHRLSKVESGWR